LENRELGTLSKNEKAYVMLGTFNCLCWDCRFDEIVYLESRSKDVLGTLSEQRFLEYYANRLASSANELRVQKSIKNFHYIAEKGTNPESQAFSFFMIGLLYHQCGDNAKAIEHYRNCLNNKICLPYYDEMRNFIKQHNTY